MAKSIGIVSLKGGVGKTSTVVSLGAALANLGKKVLLVDANFSAPNLGIHLNIIDPEYTLNSVLEGVSRIKDAIFDCGEFHVLPSSLFKKQIKNPLKLKDKLRTIKRNYDVILIDSSPALNEETLAAMLASDEILVVTTPDYPTLTTTLKAIKLANSRGTSISGLVLNKVHNKNFELSLDQIEQTSEIPIMAVIPHDLGFLKSLSEFKPSVFSSPNSRASQEYKKLAATLVGEKYKSNNFNNLFNIWRKVIPNRQDLNREVYYSRVFS